MITWAWCRRFGPRFPERRGSGHLFSCALGGMAPSVTTAGGRGPWQRDLRGPAADLSLPPVAGSSLASGSRASSTEMSVQAERAGGGTNFPEEVRAVQNVFCGIDWGGYHHQLCAVDALGRRLVDRRVAHDREGLSQLRVELSRLGEVAPVAVERSEGILVESLLCWGHPVYPVSPRIAARSRERYRVAPSKDDGFDAFVLADSLRHEHGHWRPLSRPSATLAELRSLVRDRRRTLEIQQAVEAQLRSTLEAYHPAAARLFSSVDRDITLAFVRTYSTPEQAERLGDVRMDRFLRRHSYRGRVPAEILVHRLRANLLSGSEGTTAAKRHAALGQADLLELLNRQLPEFDRAIETVLARHQ